MRFIPDIERLYKSADFSFTRENGMRLFINRLEKKVLTDKIGEAIWNALPGTLCEVTDKVLLQEVVPERLVSEFVYIFLCAGIIEAGSDRKKFTTGEGERHQAAGELGSEELVTVIVVTYNGEKFIHKCLGSLHRQSYAHMEVIVVDNASNDRTTAIIREEFPKVKLLSLRKNIHYAGGVNHGLRNSQGEYILILNQDTELDSDCIYQLLQKAKKEPKAGAVAPMMKFSELPGFINGIGNQITNHSWGTDSFIHCVDIGQFDSLEEIPSACFGAVLIRKDTLDSVGLLDKAYGSFYEDSDWSFRCWFTGWEIVPAPRAVVYHKFGASYPQGKKLFFVVRNRLRLVLKIFQGRIMLGFLKNYIKEDVRNSLSLLRKKDTATAVRYAQAYVSLLFQLPGIGLKRLSLFRRKDPEMRERDILQKNPSFYCCLHSGLDMPEIDAATIRSYYRWHLLDKIET